MPTQPTFVPLSEAELSSLFGDDPDGMRRYRLLHAVLAEGLSQREAAAAHGVSERTVRNVLRAYAQGGGSMKALIVSLLTSDAFLIRTMEGKKP